MKNVHEWSKTGTDCINCRMRSSWPGARDECGMAVVARSVKAGALRKLEKRIEKKYKKKEGM